MAAITQEDGSRSEPPPSEDSSVASSVLAGKHIESERKVYHEQEDHRRARRSVRTRRDSSRVATQGRDSGSRRLGWRTPSRTPPLGSSASTATEAYAAASTTSAAALAVSGKGCSARPPAGAGATSQKGPRPVGARPCLRTRCGAKNRAAILASVLCHKSATTIKRVFEEKIKIFISCY